MPKLSDNVNRMPASPIRKLVPSADIAKKKGLNVLHLNIGQPDVPSPVTAIEALHKWDVPVISYTRSEGTVEYREALCEYFHSHGFKDLKPNNFLVTNGGSEAIIFALSIIGDAGDEVIIPEPFYANYNGFSAQTNLKVVPVSSHIEDGFSLPSIEEFEKRITDKTRAIVICHPGNPTGYLYTKSELDKLAELVIKHDLFLISDEVYREYVYDDKHVSILSYPILKDNAIVIDSESKRFSMCGIRLGAIVSRNQEFLSAGLKYAQARLSPSLISQVIATEAHKSADEYFKESKKEYDSRRNFLVEELNKIDGIICPNPKGAFYCVAKLPVDNAESFAKWMLEEFEYKGETVMVAPAAGFYATPGMGEKEVRIAYVLEKEELKRAVEVLDAGIKAYNNK